MTKEEKLSLIYEIFSPSAPVENIDLFAGRVVQLKNIQDTINEKGQHAVIFGKRGAGKTSLANILNQIFTNIFIGKVTCNRTDNFTSIWDKALRKVKYIEPSKDIGFNRSENSEVVSLSLPDNVFIDATVMEEIFSDLESHLLFIFDEFESIEEEKTKVMMADTIKTLSDNAPNVTIIIVGIAENITDLIGHHPSLERCIRQIKLPLMSYNETALLIDNSFRLIKIKISKSVSTQIIEYSSGFPHYTHLLCKFAARESVIKNRNEINNEDFNKAVRFSIDNSDYSIRTSYKTAIKSAKNKNQFEDIVYACAVTNPDDEDNYSAEIVLEKFNQLRESDTKVESIRYNLGMLCRPERGFILEKAGTSKKQKYRFKNPLMKAYIKLKMHNKT